MQPEAVGAPGCCWFQLAVKYFLPGLYCLPLPSLWGESNPSISRPFAILIRRLSIDLALNLRLIESGMEESPVRLSCRDWEEQR